MRLAGAGSVPKHGPKRSSLPAGTEKPVSAMPSGAKMPLAQERPRAAGRRPCATSTPSTVGAGVVQPAFARLVLERQRAEAAHPLVGRRRRAAGAGGPDAQLRARPSRRAPAAARTPRSPCRSPGGTSAGRARVIGRCAGTVSSSGPPGRASTRRSASSGSSPSTGSSRRMTHSSTRISAATAVTGLVIDEMRKMLSRAASPATPTWTSPPRATAHTSPWTSPRST